MIKSYKVIIVIQFILVAVFWLIFRTFEYGNNFVNIPALQLVLIAFLPLILILFSVIIQTLVFAVINADSLNKSDETDHKDKFWKNAFYVGLVFGALTFVLAFVAIQFNYRVQIKGYYDFVNNFALFLLGIVVSSIIIGILLRVKDSVLEINKIAVYSMILLAALVFSVALFFTVTNMFSVYPYRADESIIGTLDAPANTEESEEEYMNRIGGEESESDYDYFGFKKMTFPDIETNEYLKELFDNQKYNDAKVQDIIKIFFTDFLNLSKTQSFNEIRGSVELGLSQDDDYQDIIKINEKIRRNPEGIRKAFDSYNTVIYAFLSEKIYFESNLNLVVEALIKSHEDIYSTEDPDGSLSEIYKIMVFGEKKNFPDYYYEKLSNYASEEGLSLIRKNASRGEEVEYNTQLSTVWIYSFWARRYKEKNSDVVFEILKEIKQHYEDN